VIGVDKEDLMQINIEQENVEIPETRILFSYPDPVHKITPFFFFIKSK